MNNGKDLFQFVSLQDMLNCPLGNFKENMNLTFIKTNIFGHYSI